MKLKLITTLLLILFSLPSYAEKPDWISVSELLSKAIITKDKNYTSTVHMRCGALTAVIAEISGENNDNYKTFLDVADTHFMMSSKYELDVFIARGGKKELFSANSEARVTLIRKLAKKYVDWMDHNWIKTGDHIGSDEQLISEIELCGMLAQGKDPLYEQMNTP
jgi:hypothetical protein